MLRIFSCLLFAATAVALRLDEKPVSPVKKQHEKPEAQPVTAVKKASAKPTAQPVTAVKKQNGKPAAQPAAPAKKQSEKAAIQSVTLVKKQNGTSSKYHWEQGHGNTGLYSSSRLRGPRDFHTGFSWSWQNPGGKKYTSPNGIAIDDERNIFLTDATAIWKISALGETMWSFQPEPVAPILSTGALHRGRFHFSTLDGRIFAIDMQDGTLLWENRVCERISEGHGYVSAFNGVVLAATDMDWRGIKGNQFVTALTSKNGEKLWRYRPLAYLWNFLPSFSDAGATWQNPEGTVFYQDFEGRAYHQNLRDGKLLWVSGGRGNTWTHGAPVLAGDTFYTVGGATNIQKPVREKEEIFDKQPVKVYGYVTAHRITDGSIKWERKMRMPPNNVPAVGVLPKQQTPTIIVPTGWRGTKDKSGKVTGGKTALYALNATNGRKQWMWQGPEQSGTYKAMALSHWINQNADTPLARKVDPLLITTPWSAPVIDAAGTIFVGHASGMFYALKDENADGLFQPKEISRFKTDAGFQPCSSPALAPNMMAVASTDSLFVFKERPEHRPRTQNLLYPFLPH